MGELLGYARVSMTDQNAEGQVDALTAAGASRVWTDVASGARSDRLALTELFATATGGDTVVVTRLDRLGPVRPLVAHTGLLWEPHPPDDAQ